MPAELARPAPIWRAIARSLASAARGLQAYRRIATLHVDAHHASSERAHALLVACLGPAQRQEFELSRAFTVRGQSGRRYRIAFGTVANIEVLGSRGELLYRLCAKPADLPTPAVMLAQKLMLETCEDEFLAIAARHPVDVCGAGWQHGATLRGA